MSTFTRNGIKIQYSKFENSNFALKFEDLAQVIFLRLRYCFAS